jgi:hypothetical protein
VYLLSIRTFSVLSTCELAAKYFAHRSTANYHRQIPYRFNSPVTHYTRIVTPPNTAQVESAINTTPRLGRRDVDDEPGTACAPEHQPCGAKSQHEDAQIRSSDHSYAVKLPSSASSQLPADSDIAMVTERGGSRPRRRAMTHRWTTRWKRGKGLAVVIDSLRTTHVNVYD